VTWVLPSLPGQELSVKILILFFKKEGNGIWIVFAMGYDLL
jgi:hypothetical protein